MTSKPFMFEVQTSAKDDWVNITDRILRCVKEAGVKEGLCVVFVPHTTAAVTLNENADPDVPRDLCFALEQISPDRREFRHGEGNSAAHTKSSLICPSLSLIISEGSLLLGTWQGIWFTEFDGPRNRRVFVKILG